MTLLLSLLFCWVGCCHGMISPMLFVCMCHDIFSSSSRCELCLFVFYSINIYIMSSISDIHLTIFLLIVDLLVLNKCCWWCWIIIPYLFIVFINTVLKLEYNSTVFIYLLVYMYSIYTYVFDNYVIVHLRYVFAYVCMQMIICTCTWSCIHNNACMYVYA